MAKKSSAARGLAAVLAVYVLFLVLQYFPPHIPLLQQLFGGRAYLHLLIALLAVLVCLISGGTLRRDLMLGGFRARHVPAGLLLWVAGAICMELLIALIYRLFPSVGQAGSTLTGSLSQNGLWYAVFFAALVPALCEELLFRGYMLSTLRRSMSVPVAGLVCALLFAVAHTLPVRMVPMLVFGFILSLAACWSGSVFIPMIMHFANNLAVVLSVFYPQQAARVTSLLLGNGLPVALAVAAACAALGALLLRGGAKCRR